MIDAISRPPSRVVSAAMLMDDGLIVTGIRHFSPEMRKVLRRLYPCSWIAQKLRLKKPYHMRVVEQGFVDQYGTFLSREEAWKIADREGQIFLYDPAGNGKLIPRAANQGDEGILFSENLY